MLILFPRLSTRRYPHFDERALQAYAAIVKAQIYSLVCGAESTSNPPRVTLQSLERNSRNSNTLSSTKFPPNAENFVEVVQEMRRCAVRLYLETCKNSVKFSLFGPAPHLCSSVGEIWRGRVEHNISLPRRISARQISPRDTTCRPCVAKNLKITP